MVIGAVHCTEFRSLPRVRSNTHFGKVRHCCARGPVCLSAREMANGRPQQQTTRICIVYTLVVDACVCVCAVIICGGVFAVVVVVVFVVHAQTPYYIAINAAAAARNRVLTGRDARTAFPHSGWGLGRSGVRTQKLHAPSAREWRPAQ